MERSGFKTEEIVQTAQRYSQGFGRRRYLGRVSFDCVWLSAILIYSRFTDVSLLCARTGMTHLPVSNTKTKRNDSLTEISGKSRSATTGRRGGSVKARNLYRVSSRVCFGGSRLIPQFLKVHEWHLEQNNINADGL